ncbi:GNAT family N-acetyltransferase [Empedobacter sp. R132-2]|nr:GNAT family N-acetyltransferase [Empedobacter falsenii]MDM1138370.1 GNAT family N-acetyltransferase [Empedobacter sp. R132-2]
MRMVGVHPNFLGKGIGRELIKICILFAKESDEKIIALHTSEFMNSARHLYEDLGFVMNKEQNQFLIKNTGFIC